MRNTEFHNAKQRVKPKILIQQYIIHNTVEHSKARSYCSAELQDSRT